MAEATIRQRLRYRFDRFMARGGSSIFLSLVVVFLGLLALITVVRFVTVTVYPAGAAKDHGVDLFRHLFVIFLVMTDPGNMNMDFGASPAYKVSAILAGFSGVIITSMLIAFVTTSLDQLLVDLRKGRSKVVEDEHTLILGWNDRVLEILRELVIANESEPDAAVVILAEEDKEEMDEYLRLNLPDTKTTRIITRSGSVSSMVGLETASLTTAKAVVVLAHCNDAAPREERSASDARVVKTILGTVAARGDTQDPDAEPLPVVAELFDDRARAVAAEVSDGVMTINAKDILAKILVQTSRSVGLSVVYSEILSFDGCEMYFYQADWGARTFGQIQYQFPDGVPLGVRTASGQLFLNPPGERPMASDDEILILAEDDSTIDYQRLPVAQPRELPLREKRATQDVERELLIGWNSMAPLMMREYSDYVLEGSRVDVMLQDPPEAVRKQIAELSAQLPRLELRLIDADPLDARQLEAVRPFSYDNVIILSQGADRRDVETTDSETIVILLLLRRIFDSESLNSTICDTKLISEILDSRNQELVTRAGVHDFIISNRLVSMLLAQISEEPRIKEVYDDLFSEDGSEIYLKSASLYQEEFPVELSFADMMRLAQKREEVCLGVKIKALEHDSSANFGVTLIPPKDQVYTLDARDSFIVLAEDET